MTDYSELKKLAENALGDWYESGELRYEDRSGYTCGLHHDDEYFIAAANPAAVLALIAENEKLKADLRDSKDAKLGLSWALGEINGENEKLRKDASRHRWLREHQFDVGSFYDVSEYNHKAWFEHIDDESIDRCISEDTEFAAENGL
jgi:hypothetical protein